MSRAGLDPRPALRHEPGALQGAGQLPWLAAASLVLLLAGVAVGAALGGVFPSPFGDPDQIQAFFADHPTSVQLTAVFGVLSALPVLAYTAAAVTRTGRHPQAGAAPAVALGAGAICTTMMVASALLQWTLTRDDVRADSALVRALHDLSFLTGGVGAVVFLGVLVAAVAVAASRAGLVSRPVALTGVGIGVVGMLSIVSLLWSAAAILLPMGRFPGLIWMILAGVLLSRERAAR
ncbi:hypothetical protein [Pseudonocardia lacus]|uniref:hypothetical protein n=1 Tax=Pseudonocardia lacus TaxID=2835865 RepID=UPI001BDC2EF2|nr:hypothetical protein [Pseudonocardia lacus]